jgi:hypothetical protein
MRRLMHRVLVFLGIVLMAGGVITGKHGATVIGLLIAAVNARRWMKEKDSGGKPPPAPEIEARG